MNKKIIFIIITVLFLFFVTDKFMYSMSKPETGMTYEEAILHDKPFIVLFHSDNCYYCRKFMPSFEKLSKELSHKYNFVLINTNNSKYAELYRGYMVYAIPDLMILSPKDDKAEKVPSSMYLNYEYLKNYLEKHTFAK